MDPLIEERKRETLKLVDDLELIADEATAAELRERTEELFDDLNEAFQDER